MTKKAHYNNTKSTTVFKVKQSLLNKKSYKVKNEGKFPPKLSNDRLLHKIITGFCNDTHPSQFEESGCAVCGRLTPMKNLVLLKDI